MKSELAWVVIDIVIDLVLLIDRSLTDTTSSTGR